jgi:valyl-tRNA synthetase
MTNFLDQQIAEMVNNINQQKQAILDSKLEEKGFKIDWEEEAFGRFPKLIKAVQGNKETWYYNDGTKEGIRIVTFEQSDLNSYTASLCTYTVNITHY